MPRDVDHRAVAPARVLIVDDDPDIRALVMYRLSASGYEVICADDGEAGLAAARIPVVLMTARTDDIALRGGHARGGHPLARQVAAA